MGLILDTSILIASERRQEDLGTLTRRIQARHGVVEIAISAVTVSELTHGIYRAKSVQISQRRRIFVENVVRGFVVHPFHTEIALLAGRIEGEQAAIGNIIAFEDLVIGATALHLGYQVATLNVRHFERIPGLELAEL